MEKLAHLLASLFIVVLMLSAAGCGGSPSPLRLTISSFDYEYDNLFLFNVKVEKTETLQYDVPYTVELISEGRVQDTTLVVWPYPARLTPAEQRELSKGYEEHLWATSAGLKTDLELRYSSAQEAFNKIDEESNYYAWILLTEPGRVSYEKLKDLEAQWDKARTELDKWESWREGNPNNTADEKQAFDELCKRYVKLSVKLLPTNDNSPSGREASAFFPDPNLEAAIRNAIGKPTGQIYKSDLQGLTKLLAANSRISNLSGLESCTSLVEVLLDGNQIRDVTPLSKLTNIYALSLINNNISDISPLVENSGLSKEDFLYLGNNPLSGDSLNIYIPELKQRGVYISL